MKSAPPGQALLAGKAAASKPGHTLAVIFIFLSAADYPYAGRLI
jgi:hypothetical protein